jgi:hypothetical protein
VTFTVSALAEVSIEALTVSVSARSPTKGVAVRSDRTLAACL